VAARFHVSLEPFRCRSVLRHKLERDVRELLRCLAVLVDKCKSAVCLGQHVRRFAGAGAPNNIFVHECRAIAPALRPCLPLVRGVDDT
jgi:hypothetical protein